MEKLRPSSEAKREAILETASQHFFAHGFAASAIESIAEDAGVSKVTVYNHFGSKKALFTAAVEQECEKMRGHFRIESMPGASLRARLTAIGEGMVAFLSRDEMIHFERRIAAETEHEPSVGLTFLAAGPHRMRAAFRDLLAAMHEAGEVNVPDPALAAEQFASLCKGMGDLDRRFGMARDERRDAERIAGAVELFCRAYAVDDPQKPANERPAK